MMTETVVTVEPNNRPQQPNPTTSSGLDLGWIQINIKYFTTIPGIIKLIQLVLGVICMACASPAIIGATHWFLFVVVTSFIATLLWCFAYLLGVREALTLPINWILTELINTFIVTTLYLIAFICQLSAWSHIISNWRGANIAAGVFGLFNTIAYAAGVYFLYIEHRATVITTKS